MKKTLRETQTLRAGCSKAELKIFAPMQIPFPGARDSQNLISWRGSLPLSTNPVRWGSVCAISSYRGNRPTNRHKQTHRQDRSQYTVLLSLARSVVKTHKTCTSGHVIKTWIPTPISFSLTWYLSGRSVWYRFFYYFNKIICSFHTLLSCSFQGHCTWSVL